MTISDTTVLLRAPEPSDLDTLYMLENASALAESGFTTAPLSRFELSEYIRGYRGDIYSERQLRLMIVDRASGETVGAVDITDYEPRDRRGFVGIAILESHRRRGLGTAALTLACGYAAEVLGMHQLAAQTAYDNEASRRLFERCGFKTCGSMRSWLRRGRHYADALLYQRIFP